MRARSPQPDYAQVAPIVQAPEECDRLDTESPNVETSVAPQVKATGPVAVIIVHGMGMQLRYETLNSVANAIGRTEKTDSKKPEVSVRCVRAGDTYLDRAEIQITGPSGPQEVHLYECYWAPLTEGKVGIKDVISFLLESGKNALIPSFSRKFKRWMFGRMKELPVKRGTPTNLVVTLLALFSLLVINAAAVWASTQTSLGAKAVDQRFYANVTLSVAAAMLVAVFVLGCLAIALFWRGGRVKRSNSGRLWTPFAWFIKGVCWLLFLVVIVAGFEIAYERFASSQSSNWFSIWDDWALRSVKAWVLSLSDVERFAWAVWGLTLLVSLQVRHYLIQFVGDLAVYLTGHRVSKFFEVRAQVQKETTQTARAVYSLLDNSKKFYYGRIVMAGHSLGSVVAYDALNALINEDLAATPVPCPLSVISRTGTFLTFGSPLDKTAFIFRNLAKEEDVTREALAAVRQPIIVDYGRRPKRWINLYSDYDVISAKLEYYDDPDSEEFAAQKVKNYSDPEANIYFAAHSHYWETTLFGNALRAAILDTPLT